VSEDWSNGVVEYWSCGFWIPSILDFGLGILDCGLKRKTKDRRQKTGDKTEC
jgi:hypothetical protein